MINRGSKANGASFHLDFNSGMVLNGAPLALSGFAPHVASERSALVDQT